MQKYRIDALVVNKEGVLLVPLNDNIEEEAGDISDFIFPSHTLNTLAIESTRSHPLFISIRQAEIIPALTSSTMHTGIPVVDQTPGLAFINSETMSLLAYTIATVNLLSASGRLTESFTQVEPTSSYTASIFSTVAVEAESVSGLLASMGAVPTSVSIEQGDELELRQEHSTVRLQTATDILEIRPTPTYDSTDSSHSQWTFTVRAASNTASESSSVPELETTPVGTETNKSDHSDQASSTTSVDRSALKTKNISGHALKSLILRQSFSNDVHYQVKGNLSLKCYTGLTVLPENLSIKGNLNLICCTGLTALPKNLSVGGNLSLKYCTSLTTLPENFSVRGNLDLVGCTGLTALPENLTIGDNLSLRYCSGLTALPETLFVRGYLDLEDCTGLTALPEALSVGDHLNLDGCTGLTALPENLFVGDNLFLRYCTGLTALPEKLSVRYNLFLNDCTGLTALPEKLSVGYNLILNGCTGLTALPENFSLGGDLTLNGCTGLTALPENFSLGGDLTLNGCTGLTTLPNQITTLGRTSRGFTRTVNLENTGLSDALIRRLRTFRAPGMQFHFSSSAVQPKHQFSSMEQAFAFWRTLASSDAETPELDLRSDQTVDLILFLGRLTGTADYQNQASCPVLAKRVMEVMSLLAVKGEVRDKALRLIYDSLSTCGDRVILALDNLETLQLLTTAETLAFESHDPSALRTLGLQMMQLDEVKRIARDHVKTLSWVDEVEIELAFQIGLRKQFNLPGSTQYMLFRGCAYVSDEDITNAIERVKNHCSEAQLEAYLAQWEPWKKYQRRLTVPSFNQLPSRMVAHIDDCPICAEKTDKMVELDGVHYDYSSLVKVYLEKGDNPFTNTPIDWLCVKKLIERKPSTRKKRRLNNAQSCDGMTTTARKKIKKGCG